MKKIVLPMLAILFALTAFRTNTQAPLPFCSAINKIIAEEPNEFSALKGPLVRTRTDGAKDYKLKFSIEGWPSSEYVRETDAVSVDLTSANLSRSKALELHKATLIQLEDCLDMKGKPLAVAGSEEFVIFTKSKVDAGLMLVNVTGDEWVVLLSISRES